MKIYLAILFGVVVLVNITYPQYPTAPEKWSKPEVIKVIKDWGGLAHPSSISRDGKTLFFSGNAYIEKTDTGWSEVKFLNKNIDRNLVDQACISPDGKKLFFTWYVGGWDLYYSEWDSTINDWGPAKNCGPGINTGEYAERGCSFPDDTTLYFLRSNTLFVSYFNKEFGFWQNASLNGLISDWGISATSDKKKIYFSSTRSDRDSNGNYYLNYDIAVSYNNGILPKILNFCLEADTSYLAGKYKGRFEGYPVITADGKTLYFTANYETGEYGYIYESHMIIDENGDSVVTELKTPKTNNPASNSFLYPPYPNPFNPETIISYDLVERSNLKVIIYDTLGRIVTELINEEKSKGHYKISFNASDYSLSSGIYFIQFSTDKTNIVQKAVIIK